MSARTVDTLIGLAVIVGAAAIVCVLGGWGLR